MDPIPVPAPPKASFNKNRPVSDLLLAQLKHFQHVERKQGIEIDRAMASDVRTEGGAARYIAQITRAIRSQSRPRGVVVPFAPPASKRTAKVVSRPPADRGLAIAAAAEPTQPAAKVSAPKRGSSSGKKSSRNSGKGKKP